MCDAVTGIRQLNRVRTRIVRNTATFNIMQRNSQIKLSRLIELVLNIKRKFVRARADQWASRNDTQFRHTLVEPNRKTTFVSLFLFLAFQILQSVTIRNIIFIAGSDDNAVFNKDCLVAVLLDRSHIMSHQDDGLSGIMLNMREEIITFTLERLIANSEHLIKHENIALGLMATENAKRTCIPEE